MKIVIPSRERAQFLMNRTQSTLKNTFKLNPILFVRADDSEMEWYEEYTEQYNTKIQIQEPNVLGASGTYDFLINEAIEKNQNYLIILDDDLYFKMHNPIPNNKPDFMLVPQQDLKTLFSHVLNMLCPEIPIFTLTPMLTRKQDNPIRFCTGLGWAYFFYLPHFREYSQYRFSQGRHIEARCDLNLALQLLTNGFLTCYLTTLLIPNEVNYPGGCSTYRTIQFEQASVRYLKRAYPDFIRLVKKKGWINDSSVIRYAPYIAWKKAFNKELFIKRFHTEPRIFCKKIILEYQDIYANFIREIRSRKCH